jgi:hypothetical protein
MKTAALIQLLNCSANRLPWHVVSDSRSGGKVWADSFFRAVGHCKGSKRLLNTNAGVWFVQLFATKGSGTLVWFSPKNQQSFGVL